jgi:hypothetical protein
VNRKNHSQSLLYFDRSIEISDIIGVAILRSPEQHSNHVHISQALPRFVANDRKDFSGVKPLKLLLNSSSSH